MSQLLEYCFPLFSPLPLLRPPPTLLVLIINHIVRPRTSKNLGAYSSFQPNVIKPKLKLFLWPIAIDANSTMNQSGVKVNTCDRRKARENTCKQSMIRACNRRQARENSREQSVISFGLSSYWLRKWQEFC